MRQRGRDEVVVSVDAWARTGPRRAGWLRRSGAGQNADISFEYDRAWLESADAFSLEPSLYLGPGEQRRREGGGLHAIFSDASPDRWGRRLLERRESLLAKREGRKVRALDDWDFLVGANDATRMGALRLQRPADGVYVDDQTLAVPPKASLRDLEAAADRLERGTKAADRDIDRWLDALVAPGASLGGARPKATFENAGEMWIAKFPAPNDRRDVGAWEYVLGQLAAEARIDIPPHGLLSLGSEHHTFIARRFDRTETHRRMFASAMTLLDLRDHASGASYLDIAQALETHGTPTAAAIAVDLEELFRRVVFNALTGHRDDHLRNHGFLHDGSGWRLAPAFDQNPIPDKATHELAFDRASALPDLGTIAETARFYRLSERRATAIVSEVRAAVSGWRRVAGGVGIARDELELMANAFMA